MNIVIIDVRHADGPGRANHLAGALANAAHNARVFAHVSGANWNASLRKPYTEWPPNLKTTVSEIAGDSVILLHVGDQQTGAKAALQECYGDKHVICFSGAPLPPWCLADCHANHLHTFISGSIPAGKQWPDWSIQQLLKASRSIESGDWTTARNALSSFDPRLEENLDALYAALKNNTPSDELRQLRERLLGS